MCHWIAGCSYKENKWQSHVLNIKQTNTAVRWWQTHQSKVKIWSLWTSYHYKYPTPVLYCMQASPSCLMWWQTWDQSLEISVTASHNEHLSAAVCLSYQPTRGTEIFTFNDNNSLYLMIVNTGFFLIFMWYSVLLKRLIWLYFHQCTILTHF